MGRDTGMILAVADREGVFGAANVAEARLLWTYADNAANDAQPRDTEMDREVARQFAARARQEALRHNRAGDFAAAASALRGVAHRIRSYAGRDPELRALAQELEGEQPDYLMAMAPADLKQRHFASSNLARSRTAQGAALRRPS